MDKDSHCCFKQKLFERFWQVEVSAFNLRLNADQHSHMRIWSDAALLTPKYVGFGLLLWKTISFIFPVKSYQGGNETKSHPMNERDLVKGQTEMKEANRCVGGMVSRSLELNVNSVWPPILTFGEQHQGLGGRVAFLAKFRLVAFHIHLVMWEPVCVCET